MLEEINDEIKHHTFDVTKYSSTKKIEFEVSHLIDLFEGEKLKSVAPSYQHNVKIYCKIHRAYWKNADVRDIRKIAVKGYLSHLDTLIPGAKTRANTYEHFKTFMNWCCHDLEIIGIVPKFPTVDYALPTIHAISADTMMMILENHVPAEHYPIMAFLFTHPVRPGEERALKPSKIDIEQNVIHIDSTFSDEVYRQKRKSKKAPPVLVPIHPDMKDWLTKRKEAMKLDPDGFVFLHPTTGRPYTMQNINALWERIRASAELPSYLKLYDCTRHSLATLGNKVGLSLLDIKTMLGHTKTTMSERYPLVEIQRIGAKLAEIITLRPQTVRDLSVAQKRASKKVINQTT